MAYSKDQGSDFFSVKDYTCGWVGASKERRPLVFRKPGHREER